MSVRITRYMIDVPEAEVEALRARLRMRRLPVETPGAAAISRFPLERLEQLLRLWEDGYDWRPAERRLNAFPQVMIEIDGQRVHAIVARGADVPGEPRLPVVVSHGWPYTFAEMTRLIPELTAAGMDVIVPSLPGFGFSDPLPEPFTSSRVAALWHRVMTEALGYERYLTYGEDVGTWVSDRLAADHPEAVAGLFATHAAFPPSSRWQDPTEEEKAWVAWLGRKWEGHDAYSRVQSTRPDVLAVALTDSPAGLAAWVIEKLLSWSGDAPERSWSDEELLTTASLYWFTGSIGTSFRAYADDRFEAEMPTIGVPVRVKVQHGERGFPRSYAARTYLDIRSWEELPDGGHFAAWQNPHEVAEGIIDLEASVR